MPLEIALKIAEKIRARQPFAAYILLPMWPEGEWSADSIANAQYVLRCSNQHLHTACRAGNPRSAIVQEVLAWQTRTLRAQYQIVAKVL